MLLGDYRVGWSMPVKLTWGPIFRKLHPGFFLAIGPLYIRHRPDSLSPHTRRIDK